MGGNVQGRATRLGWSYPVTSCQSVPDVSVLAWTFGEGACELHPALYTSGVCQPNYSSLLGSLAQ